MASNPLHIKPGTLKVTPFIGDLEFDGTHLYIVISGTRYQLDQQGGGGVTALSVTTSSTLTTAANKIYVVFVNATGGDVAITLPAGDATTKHLIKRIDSTANKVTFVGTIDGSASYLGASGLLPLNGFTLLYNGSAFYSI